MKCISALLPLLLVICAVRASGQNPAKQYPPEKADEVVIVTANLVQVDAIVTDKSGRPVTDLQAEDFELLENGHAKQITGFSYISLTAKDSSPNAAPASRAVVDSVKKSGPPATLHAIRPESVRRAIAIVVDDFGLSFESIARLRGALEKFIQEQTLDTDLIAVIRASGGAGAMQQFTSNRAQLLATIKRIRWYPTGRGSMSAVDSFSPIDSDEKGLDLRGYSSNRPPDLSSKSFFGGSLGALGFVVQGLSRFPGRKSIVLISDNLPVTHREAQANGTIRGLDKLIERANQYSIVISTIDARGLPKAGLTADDSQYNLAANQIMTRGRERRMKFTVQQDGLSYLAQQTGGVFIHDNNDLTDGLRQIIDGEQGYYLLAYRPDDLDADTGAPRARTYKVTLRLKRPGLEVRSRSSFHRTSIPRTVDGPGDSPIRGKDDLLREALASPFVREGVRLKMTALFTGGSEIRILLHVDARDVEFVKSPEDTYNGSFDIAAVAFDDNGRVARQVARTQTLRVPSGAYEQLLRNGFVYSMTFPLEVPGPYQLRLALRDGASGRLGSDSQFVAVPDPKKTNLTVSGFVVQRLEAEASLQHGAEMPQTSVEGTGGVRARKGPAVRRFDAGDLLTYSYLIYGVRRAHATDSSNLWSQIRLFRADKELFTGRQVPVVISQKSSSGGLVAEGNLRLGTELTPGVYFLQVIVTDKLAPVEKQVSDQWIDFEIVNETMA